LGSTRVVAYLHRNFSQRHQEREFVGRTEIPFLEDALQIMQEEKLLLGRRR
jgi:hypothetical protein